MIPTILANVPPFSSIQIQLVEGGFLCVVPPATPVAAKLSGDVAAMMHLFLGVAEQPSEKSSASYTDGLAEHPVLFEWPPYTLPAGSVFQTSKVQRIDSKGGKHLGYMMTYHAATQGSAHQVVAFNRATVMDHLRGWLFTPTEVGEVESEDSLVTLSGMRINPDMTMEDETIFRMEVVHSSRVSDYTGPTPYVARATAPRMVFGLADADVLSYVVEELNGDLAGHFAARLHDGWLEFGPRLEDE